jgi:hypothetical protein
LALLSFALALLSFALALLSFALALLLFALALLSSATTGLLPIPLLFDQTRLYFALSWDFTPRANNAQEHCPWNADSRFVECFPVEWRLLECCPWKGAY